jgi:hypothetical protein
MTETEKEALLRQYAAGDLTRTSLRGRGIDNYRDVLAGLGALGLRPPVAPMDGPNVEARLRGRAIIREALKAARVSSKLSSLLETEARRQSRAIAERAADPTSDEYAVMREIEAELDRDDFADEWKA